MGGGALKWEVYSWRAGLLRRVVSKPGAPEKDRRGSQGLESGDFGRTSQGKGENEGMWDRVKSFDRDDGRERKSILEKG